MARGVDEPWLAARELPAAVGRAWAREWPAWFGPQRGAVPRAESKEDLARVATPLGAVVAKREHPGGWRRPLARLGARSSRSVRAFRLGQALLARGLATPEPLAVLGRPGDAVLVTRFVEGCGPWELLGELASPDPLLALLADGLARLHAAGFRHRDLQAANLLLARGSETHQLHWTDLDGLRHVGTVERRQRARDLGRLAASFESRAARAAGIRAGHWPALVQRYLTLAHGRPPHPDELERLLAATRLQSTRAIRRHLETGRPVH